MTFFIRTRSFQVFRAIKRFYYSSNTNVDEVETNIISKNNLKEGLKSLHIAILGLPNVGKSTLINQLVHRPLCAASSKVHTTRVKASAIYTQDNTQLVFVDTPGLVTPSHIKKFKLDTTFAKDVKLALKNVNIVGIIQDMQVIKAREVISDRILNTVEFADENTSFILILNKIDKIKHKKLLLDVVKNLTSKENYPKFTDVFMISALTGNGVDDLRNYFFDLAKPSTWTFDKNVYTDQKPEDIVQRTVKAKIYDNLKDEIPYQLEVTVEHFGCLEDGSIKTAVIIKPSSNRIVKIIKGAGGCKVKAIAKQAEQELCNAFRTTVRLLVIINTEN